jgi:Domain of unknown function (DUF4369)
VKKLLYFVVVLCPLFATAQEQYAINTTVKQLKDGNKVFLVYPDGSHQITDSAVVNNGQFSFKGIIKYPVMARMFLSWPKAKKWII